jgi:membrane fusion protein, multidrug efflux system
MVPQLDIESGFRHESTVRPEAIFCRSWLLLACILSLVVASCGQSQQQAKREFPPVPVDVAAVTQKDMPLYLEGIGNVVAYNSVLVQSRVTGELLQRHFKQGDRVAKGQRLFTVDPAPFEAKLKEADARVNQTRVQYLQSKKDYERYQGLHAEKAISLDQLESKEVDMNSKLYELELRRAEMETAKLNLGYCFIDSPLDAESGEILVDEHNIINANQDRLVTLKQVQPIKVRFSVPGKHLDEVKNGQARAPLEVEASVQGSEKVETGPLTLIDNQVNLKTGMIVIEGTFPNQSGTLWPGQFVKVRLKVNVTPNAVVVPSQAVNDGPSGQYVWAVNQDQTVVMRPIKVVRSGNGSHIISDGLKNGETVVTDGQLMLRPGARIITRSQAEEMMKKMAGKNPKETAKP